MPYTQDQQKAIDARGKNILVAAAAGSGKTRVLVDRIIRQLIDGEFDVDAMLVVTFTNAAAAEMRERIETALQATLRQVDDVKLADRLDRQVVLLTGANICTFHSFCQKVIRQHIEAIDVDPQFRLAGEQEMVLLKRDTLETLLEQQYERPERAEELPDWESFISFTDDYGSDHGDEAVYEAVLQLYQFCQSQPFPVAWLQRQQAEYEAVESLGDSKWMQAALPAVSRTLDMVIRAYDEICLLVHDTDPADLQQCWEPYVAVVQEDLEQLEEIRRSLRHYEAQPLAGGWDQLITQAAAMKWKALRGKDYKTLKDDYPSIREAFDAQRNQVKKVFKAEFSDKYLRESEAEILEHLSRCGQIVRAYTQLTIQFIAALQAAKKERNILDFNDLEHYALEILCADPDGLQRTPPVYVPTEAALALREQLATIMVDEYQDTNGVQEAILSLIARENNRFTVGDVKQSIYRFRLADPYLFQAKYDTYPLHPGEDDLDQLITMKENFRSRAEVLAPINYVFDQVMTREAVEIEYDERSKLYPGMPYEEYPDTAHTLKGPMELDLVLRGHTDAGNSVDTDAAADDETETAADELEGFGLEAQHIADRIQALMASQPVVFDKDRGEHGAYRPIQYRDIAVLLRAVRGKANTLLETLRKNSIPAYADVDGGYFEAAEVRLVLALLSVIDNVHQDIPLAAVLASPIGGFSMEELVGIRLSAEDGDLYDGLLASFSADTKLSADLAGRTAAFQLELAGWRSYAVSHSVPELIWTLYRDTGYYDYVGSLKGGLLRQANLRMLADRAADYERTNYRGLFRFLRFIEDLKKRDTDLSVARTLGASEDVVRIMSIHKSKGLEFPVVIVADTAKGFNTRDAKGTFLLHQQLGIGPKLVERSTVGRQIYTTLPWQTISSRIIEESKAEEMRVLYVAMTRAREKLILTGVIAADKAAKKAQGWCKYVGSVEPQLPDAQIRQAGSYLDWVAPALARHADGQALRELAADASPAGQETAQEHQEWLDLEPDAHFAIHILTDQEVRQQSQAEDQADALLQAVEALQPMPSTDARAQVEHCLNWQYDLRGLNHVPAKLTVTEIKHRFAAFESAELTAPSEQMLVMPADGPAEPELQDWPLPRFLQEKKSRLSASERGTIMHTVMQHINWNADISYAGIQRQVEALEAGGVLQPGQRDAVYIKGVQAFIESAVGQRLRKARQVWRELPFSRMLMARRFYPEVQDESEQVFTQGVIDLLFEDEAGTLVLVDYKTDRNPSPEKALRRYQIQVDLYSEAVSAILQRPVGERYLYLLQSGETVAVPVAMKISDE